MSVWEDYRFEERVMEILRNARTPRNHHFGHQFLTAYQIAIEYDSRYLDDSRLIGKPVGGLNAGSRNTLAQYIANQLSKKIKSGELHDVEGAFISSEFLSEISYNERNIISSLTNSNWGLSMFRYREERD